MDKLNTYLEVLELLNSGTNHSPDYIVERLSDEGTVEDALATYFASVSTNSSPSQPATAWHITLGEPMSDWHTGLSQVTMHWFFEQEFSPNVGKWVRAEVVERLVKLLEEELSLQGAQEVLVTPPMFYDLVWQDYLLLSETGCWLLHFGFSD